MKKIVSILAIILILATALVGCGKDNTEKKDDNKNNTSQSQNNSTEDKNNSTDPTEDINSDTNSGEYTEERQSGTIAPHETESPVPQQEIEVEFDDFE